MKQQIMDESTGISYTLRGDYYVPNLVLPEEEYSIGKYGLMRKHFLQEHRKGTYSTPYSPAGLMSICMRLTSRHTTSFLGR